MLRSSAGSVGSAFVAAAMLLAFAFLTAGTSPAAAAPAKPKKPKPAVKVNLPVGKSFKDLDKDHNGFLSMAEVYGSLPPKGHSARSAFDKADADRNDWLAPAEFQRLKAMGFRAEAKKGGGQGGQKRNPGKMGRKRH